MRGVSQYLSIHYLCKTITIEDHIWQYDEKEEKTYTINYHDLDLKKKNEITTIKMCLWHADKPHDSPRKDFGKYSIDRRFEVDHIQMYTYVRDSIPLTSYNVVIKLRVITACGWNQFDLKMFLLRSVEDYAFEKKSFFFSNKYSEKKCFRQRLSCALCRREAFCERKRAPLTDAIPVCVREQTILHESISCSSRNPE